MTTRAAPILTADYITDRWSRLFHMAEAGSWRSIQKHGLRSTSALLDLYEVTGPKRDPIEARRRPESVLIKHPVYGTATIRDNKPINETVLRRTLEGVSEPDWYRTLALATTVTVAGFRGTTDSIRPEKLASARS